MLDRVSPTSKVKGVKDVKPLQLQPMMAAGLGADKEQYADEKWH